MPLAILTNETFPRTLLPWVGFSSATAAAGPGARTELGGGDATTIGAVRVRQAASVVTVKMANAHNPEVFIIRMQVKRANFFEPPVVFGMHDPPVWTDSDTLVEQKIECTTPAQRVIYPLARMYQSLCLP